MSALPQPLQPSPNNRDIIQNLRAEYGGAVLEAMEAASLTCTVAWQRLYHSFIDAEKAARRDMAKRLRAVCDRIEDAGLDEEDEKAVKDVLKTAVTLENAKAVFEKETVARVRKPVDDCSRIIEDYTNRAARIEHANPLIEVGLVEMVRIEFAKHHTARWSDETGMVTIVDPESR
jgi:hypothetical protein